MDPTWQADRGQLNHHWLQNSVLVALNHALGIVSGAVRSTHPARALAEDLLRWQDRRGDVVSLLERFETEMTPALLLGRAPLSRCSEETKSWLRPLVHELWLRREAIDKRIAAAMRAWRECDRVYRLLQDALEALSETPAEEGFQALESPLNVFTAACEELAAAISALPREIQCV